MMHGQTQIKFNSSWTEGSKILHTVDYISPVDTTSLSRRLEHFSGEKWLRGEENEDFQKRLI
jgi:hypothetical protein